jgi:hypothetical protein
MRVLIIQFLQPPATSYLFGPNILLSTLFSKTISLLEWQGVWTLSK